jgi:predicted nuclease with TOPRIM domain
MKLYELSNAYAQVLERLEEEGETLSLRDTLESIQEPLEDKAENIAKLIQSINADCEVIKGEEKRLADRRKALENKVSSLKQYLFEQLEFAGIGKVKRPTITISVQNNPPSVDVVDDSLIPKSYWIVPEPVPTLDKKSIMKILKEGEEIPGVTLKQGRGLRIK